MRNNMDDLLEFTIPDSYITSLIYGDDSGLEDEDIEKIDKFVERIVEKYGNANFMLPEEDKMDLGFQPYNDIDRLGSDCSLLYLRPTKNYTESSDTKETIYIYEDNQYTAKELIDLADEMAEYEKMDSGVYIDIDDVYSAIAFLGEDEVRIKSDVMMDGGMMAKGGMTKHGLMIGDVIGIALGDSIFVYNKNDEQYYVVNLDKGKRSKANLSDSHKDNYFADGGMMADGGMIGDRVKVSDFTDYSYHNTLESAKEYADNLRARGYEAIVTESPSGYEAKHRVLWKKNIRDSRNEKRVYYSGGYMAKGGVHKVNRKYAYFAVNKKTNKIVDGWEIVDDVESLKYYAKMDLEDNDMNPKDYNLLSAKTLKARGIDPYSWDSWAKTGEYADGGMMAKGGGINAFKKGDKVVLKFDIEYRKGNEVVFEVVGFDNDKLILEQPNRGVNSRKVQMRSYVYPNDVVLKSKMRMGGATFQDKVDAISESLEGRKVKPSYRKAYGKTYNKNESIVAAKRIAGAMRKKEMARKK